MNSQLLKAIAYTRSRIGPTVRDNHLVAGVPRFDVANAIVRRCTNWTGLTCLLAISIVLFLQNLGTPYITLWDEAVHVNVVKNLAEHCCLPQLHRSTNIGTIYQAWTDNTVWLHKPLLPFYVSAGIYNLFGNSLWAFRFSGAMFAVLTAVVIYLTGHRFFNDRIGLCGAAIFSLNPFTNNLVHGRQYSGFPDLALAFFVSVALYLILDWTESRSAATLRWLGLVLGLAYMCKGGLALPPFAALAGIVILTGSLRDLVAVLQSITVFVIVGLPERLYWLAHYPVEYRYEQQQQLLHFLKVIEGHGGAWHSYLTRSLPFMLALPLVPFAYFSIVWVLTRCRSNKPGCTLSFWTLAYVVPLSVAASKVDNFVFSALPAIALVVPHVLENLMRGRLYRLVLSLCISSVVTTIVQRATRSYDYSEQLTIIAAIAVFGAALSILSLIKFELRRLTASVLLLTSAAMLLLYVRRDISANRGQPADSLAQMALRQTGSELRSLLNKNVVVLLRNNMVDLAYLYTMYWSGVDVIDICLVPQPAAVITGFRESKNLYFITNNLLPGAPIARLPIGNLYSLSETAFEVWSPVATGACQSSNIDSIRALF